MNVGYVVIIPHYNDSARLGRCLDALRAQDRAGVDVVVVDNGSTEPLDQAKAANPDVRFVTEPGKGAARARNRGWRKAARKRSSSSTLTACLSPTGSRQRGGQPEAPSIVGGAIDVFDETPPPRSGAEAFETVFAFNYKDYIERKGFSVTANLVTTRTVFEAVGPFTNGLSEDAEWCFRARAMGYRLALDEGMRVAHPTRSNWPALVRKWRRIVREMYALHRQAHPGPTGRLLWFARALAMAASWLPHLPKILFSPRLNGAGSVCAVPRP